MTRLSTRASKFGVSTLRPVRSSLFFIYTTAWKWFLKRQYAYVSAMGVMSGIRPPQFQEVRIVSFLKEYVIAVVAAIVNMIEGSMGNGWDIRGHE